MSCRQGEEVGKLWKAGTHGDVSLSDEVVEPRLSLQPESPVEACRAAWMGGDFISNAEPQSNQTFCQSNECILGTHVMRACRKATGESKSFSANIAPHGPVESE